MICDLAECADLICYFGEWVRRPAILRLLGHLASGNEAAGIAECETMSRRIHSIAQQDRVADEGPLSNVTWGHPFLVVTIPSKINRIVRLEYVGLSKVRVTLSNIAGGDLAGLAFRLRKRELILASLFEIAELAKTGLSAPFRDMVEDGVL